MNSKVNLLELDILRACAIVLIVLCHLHMFIKLTNYQHIFDLISNQLASIGLSLFFFISGFSLYINNDNIKSLHHVKTFYKKRFIKIFPLYWTAFISYTLYESKFGEINSFEMPTSNIYYLMNIIGLQGMLPERYGFLWFMGVIILLYLLYPVFIKDTSIYHIIKISTAILILMVSLHISINVININFFYFYGVFIVGILIGHKARINPLEKILPPLSISILLFIIILFMIYLIISNYQLGRVLRIILFTIISVMGCTLSYYIIIIIYNRIPIGLQKIAIYVSSGSFSIYLFHIFFLNILVEILNALRITDISFDLCVILAIVPLFIICNRIQKIAKIRSVNNFASEKMFR